MRKLRKATSNVERNDKTIRIQIKERIVELAPTEIKGLSTTFHISQLREKVHRPPNLGLFMMNQQRKIKNRHL